MKQPTINNKPMGRYQKIELYNIIASQQAQIKKMEYILNLSSQAIQINKKNLEYFKERSRLLEDNYISLEELEDK